MTVKLISVTPDAEQTMAYIARVSNPANQDSENYAGLLRYCIKHNHWSVFEQSSMSLEIETNRGIAAQILRHRSFTFQEFSQRYADSSLLSDYIPVPTFVVKTLRIVRTRLMILVSMRNSVSRVKFRSILGTLCASTRNSLLTVWQKSVLALFCLWRLLHAFI